MKKFLLSIMFLHLAITLTNAQFHAGVALDAGVAPKMDNAYVSVNAEGLYSIHRVDLGLGVGIGTTTKEGIVGTIANYHRTQFVPLYFHAQYNIPHSLLFVNTDIGYNFSFGQKAYEEEIMPADTKHYDRVMMYVNGADYYKGLNESRDGFFFKVGFGYNLTKNLNLNVYAGLTSWNRCSILNVSKINEDGTPVYLLDENGNKIEMLNEDGVPMLIKTGYTLNSSIYAYWRGVIHDAEIAANPDIKEKDLWVNNLPESGWEEMVYDYVVNTLGYGVNLKGDPAYGRKGLYDSVFETRYRTETEQRTYSQKSDDNTCYVPSNPLRYLKFEIGFKLKYRF